jgi:hypothetical protein
MTFTQSEVIMVSRQVFTKYIKKRYPILGTRRRGEASRFLTILCFSGRTKCPAF